MDNYTREQYDALLAEFRKIKEVPAQMEAGCTDRLLLEELRPWLVEFGRLGERGEKALGLIRLLEEGKTEEFWTEYTSNLMTADRLASYNAHKCGTFKLQPFYENAMDDLGIMFYEKLSGEKSSVVRGIGRPGYPASKPSYPYTAGLYRTFYRFAWPECG